MPKDGITKFAVSDRFHFEQFNHVYAVPVEGEYFVDFERHVSWMIAPCWI